MRFCKVKLRVAFDRSAYAPRAATTADTRLGSDNANFNLKCAAQRYIYFDQVFAAGINVRIVDAIAQTLLIGSLIKKSFFRPRRT